MAQSENSVPLEVWLGRGLLRPGLFAPIVLIGLAVVPWLWPENAANGPAIVLPAVIQVDVESDHKLVASASEITVADWAICVAANVCMEPRGFDTTQGDIPMTGVNWLDVQRYLDWLGDSTGQDWRLPTRSEWIAIAAEAAPIKKPPLFEDPRMAWADYDLTAKPKSTVPRPVGNFGKNSYGFYDVTGNVWEWTSTCWSNSTGPSDSCQGVRIAMGEHEAVLSELTRDPAKAGCSAGVPPSAVGFRIVRTVTKAT